MLNLPKELRDAVKAAEEALGGEIPEKLALEVLAYARRKLDVIKMQQPEYTDAYLPVLFENEIRDGYMRRQISEMSQKKKEATV